MHMCVCRYPDELVLTGVYGSSHFGSYPMLRVLCVSSHLVHITPQETKAQRGDVICWGHTAGRDRSRI